MSRSILARLIDIREAIDSIQRHSVGRTSDYLENEELLRAGVERWLEIISEASRYIPVERKARFSEIPWRKIAGIGNVLRHDYEQIAPRVIWNTIRTDLPKLRAAIEAMISEEEG